MAEVIKSRYAKLVNVLSSLDTKLYQHNTTIHVKPSLNDVYYYKN